MSRLIHFFTSLLDPNDNFLMEPETVFFLQFLWDGKQSKIGEKTVCQLYENGGLKMLNVQSFMSAVKISS